MFNWFAPQSSQDYSYIADQESTLVLAISVPKPVAKRLSLDESQESISKLKDLRHPAVATFELFSGATMPLLNGPLPNMHSLKHLQVAITTWMAVSLEWYIIQLHSRTAGISRAIFL
jgi:hypothetical protein